MTGSDRTETTFEQTLERALAVDPGEATLSRLDLRVGDAIERSRARPSARKISRWLPHRPVLRRPRLSLVAGVLVAVLVAGTAVSAGLGLIFERAAGPIQSLKVAYDNATPIGTSVSHRGYRVTLDRAYVDATQVVVALEVSDSGGSSDARPPQVNSAELVDAKGHRLALGAGGVAYEPGRSANLASFAILPGTTFLGPYTLVVTSLVLLETAPESDAPASADDEVTARTGAPTVADTWRFTFDVPSHGGVAGEPVGPVTKDGVTVTVEAMQLSPSMVSAVVAIDGLADGGDWSAVGHFEHGGQRLGPLSFGLASPDGKGGLPANTTLPAPRDGRTRVVFMSFETLPERLGEWRLVIDEIALVPAPGAPGSTVRLAGPWVLEIRVL
jgi:hypothetical protein